MPYLYELYIEAVLKRKASTLAESALSIRVVYSNFIERREAVNLTEGVPFLYELHIATVWTRKRLPI